MNFAHAIVSPCIKVCTMNPATGLCAGCGRTIEEIARWGGMSHVEREMIMRELPARPARDMERR